MSEARLISHNRISLKGAPMIENSLSFNFKFTEAAKKYLQPGQVLPFRASSLAQQSVLHGDKIRIDAIPNCPWFVVSERYWTLGETTTLTIWLDEQQD